MKVKRRFRIKEESRDLWRLIMQPLGLSIPYILSIAVIDNCCSLMVTCEIPVLFKAGLVGTVKSCKVSFKFHILPAALY
jgi:hypothetical protein